MKGPAQREAVAACSQSVIETQTTGSFLNCFLTFLLTENSKCHAPPAPRGAPGRQGLATGTVSTGAAIDGNPAVEHLIRWSREPLSWVTMGRLARVIMRVRRTRMSSAKETAAAAG
ncbi:hypothetical protein GCM10027586_08280 [Kineococcus gypseus]